jgi:hypothetical protein
VHSVGPHGVRQQHMVSGRMVAGSSTFGLLVDTCALFALEWSFVLIRVFCPWTSHSSRFGMCRQVCVACRCVCCDAPVNITQQQAWFVH